LAALANLVTNTFFARTIVQAAQLGICWYNTSFFAGGSMDKKTHTNRPQPAYVLKVNIKKSKPSIWRQLSVPADCTLGDLHEILQIAFGWDNDHMHSFTINSEMYGMNSIDFGYDNDMSDEDSVCLYDLDLQPKQKFRYLYDFGDSWEHEISVSKIIPADAGNSTLPRCLGGERAGPFEDSGGIWGYESMLEILKDPSHKGYEEIHEWAGDFDPEYFSLDEINAQLEQAFTPRPS
jgi:hypothetical protein